MARVGLTSIINGSFVGSFTGLAQQNKSSGTQGLLGKSGDAASVAEGLRYGAQSFAKAVQGLGAVSSFLSLSQSTLEELGSLTDKMIQVAERATKASASKQSRRRADKEFKDLAAEFISVVEDAKVGDKNALDVQDISDVFVAVGLDKEAADSIANVFEQFQLLSGESSVASENNRAPRPVRIPKDAYGKAPQQVTEKGYDVDQVSDAAAVTGSLSDVNSVYEAQDSVTGVNPTQESLITRSEGPITSGLVPGLSSDVSLLSVNEQTGYSIISSSEDFLGSNTDGVSQLYLADDVGNILQQFTNFSAGSNVSFDSVDQSGDDLTIAVSFRDNVSGTSELHTYSVASFGSDPATATDTTFENSVSGSAITNVKLNNAGSYIGYFDTSGSLNFKDTATQTQDATLPALPGATDFGFVGDNQLAVANGGTSVQVVEYGSGSVDSYSPGALALQSGTFATLESEGSFAFVDGADNNLKLVDYNGSGFTSSSIADLTGSTVNQVSLALNSTSGSVDVGVDGTISGDLQRSLSRYELDASGSSYTRTNISEQYAVTEGDGSFGAATAVSGGANLTDVVTGYTGSDSNLDLVTTDITNGTVNVLAGNGDGTFGASVSYNVGIVPLSVTLSDVNGDSINDILASSDSGTVSVLLGNADGTFSASTSFAAASAVTDLVVKDFNGDNKLDIATTDTATNTISIQLGNGDGTFNAYTSFNALGTVESIEAGDFNNDGKLDLAATLSNTDSIAIFVGNGNGTFAAASSFSTGNLGSRSDLSLGDVNEDGQLDIITADRDGNTVSVLLGNGNGDFSAANSFSTDIAPTDVLLTDVNGDRFLDIVAATESTSDALNVLLGNGDGTFSSQTSFATGNDPQRVATGDFNGDGVSDLVSANYTDGTLSVLIGNTQNSNIYGGAISGASNVFTHRDTVLGYNDSYVSLFTRSTGEVVSALPNTLSADIDLLTVNQSTGFSVIESTDDLLGSNSSNYSQLFLVDATGRAVQQLTENNALSRTYQEAAISSDNHTVIFKADIAGVAEVGTSSFVNYGDAPSNNTITILDTSTVSEDFSNVKISSDGSYVAYTFTSSSGDTNIEFKDTATQTSNATLQAQLNSNLDYGFIDTDTLAIVQQDVSNQDIVSYRYDDTQSTIVYNVDSIGEFSTIEKDLTNSGSYYLAYEDVDSRFIRLVQEGTGEVSQYYFSSAIDDLKNLSLAPTETGDIEVDVGFFGDLSEVSGDSDDELYRLSYEDIQVTTNGSLISKVAREFESIFDRQRSLTNRPDAYRVLSDLKELRKQIDSNLEAFKTAQDTVENNLELARRTGIAFLDVSEQISGTEQADEIARKLRSKIRSSPREALAQAENLRDIAVASLVLEEDGLFG